MTLPLPTHEEVLICNQSTTTEEVSNRTTDSQLGIGLNFHVLAEHMSNRSGHDIVLKPTRVSFSISHAAIGAVCRRHKHGLIICLSFSG